MERITHKGRMIEVVQADVNENGVHKTFEYARRSPGIRLIITQGSNFLISKEFRHEYAAYDYRLPGGKVFDSLAEYGAALASNVDIQEAATQAAIKEAREEAGIDVKDISFFHRSVCGASVVWDLLYFVVKDFTEVGQALEHGEDITMETISFSEAKKMCLDGRIGEERSALVLLRYLEQISS